MPLFSTTNLCQVANQEIPVGGQASVAVENDREYIYEGDPIFRGILIPFHDANFLELNGQQHKLLQAKALETIVAGSLRREQAAESTAKLLTGEIEQLNILVYVLDCLLLGIICVWLSGQAKRR